MRRWCVGRRAGLAYPNQYGPAASTRAASQPSGWCLPLLSRVHSVQLCKEMHSSPWATTTNVSPSSGGILLCRIALFVQLIKDTFHALHVFPSDERIDWLIDWMHLSNECTEIFYDSSAKAKIAIYAIKSHYSSVMVIKSKHTTASLPPRPPRCFSQRKEHMVSHSQ